MSLRALAVLVLATAALTPAAAPAGAVTLEGTVVRVIDGDTVRVMSRGFETPVRLIGIDTPETQHPGEPVQCFGPQAAAATTRLLPAGLRVRLATDATQATRDRYGRLLAYVHAGPGPSVNLRLVRGGFAKVYVYGDVRFRHAGSFFRAQHRARAAGRGLWGPPCLGDTDAPAPSAVERAARRRPRCDPNYARACVPVTSRDLDCPDIRQRVRVVRRDPHRFDGDGDGWGCERWG